MLDESVSGVYKGLAEIVGCLPNSHHSCLASKIPILFGYRTSSMLRGCRARPKDKC